MPETAGAQATDTETLPVPAAAQGILDSFQKPLHPIFGSVAPGGGLGAGVGYTSPKDRAFYQDAIGMFTVNRYWLVQAEAGYRTGIFQTGLFGEVRDMNRVAFFGIGPDSLRSKHTTFGLRESAFGVRGWVQPAPRLRLGGTVQAYSPDLSSGASSDFVSIETVFRPGEVPGLMISPVFTRARGFAEFTYRAASRTRPPNGIDDYAGKYQVALEAVRDHDAGLYNFQRVELEAQHRFSGLRPDQRLTLHGLVSVTNSDATVPFYLQYTLGGGGALSAFRPNTIGTDGTKATLRAFENYRFRDRNLLLLQAEYRIPVHRMVHATVFYDAGQVAADTAGLFDGLKQGGGFSLSMMRKGSALLRLDVGYGSGEGAHIFWGFGGFGL